MCSFDTMTERMHHLPNLHALDSLLLNFPSLFRVITNSRGSSYERWCLVLHHESFLLILPDWHVWRTESWNQLKLHNLQTDWSFMSCREPNIVWQFCKLQATTFLGILFSGGALKKSHYLWWDMFFWQSTFNWSFFQVWGGWSVVE